MNYLRYYWNPTTQRLILSPGAVSGIDTKEPVQHIVHAESPAAWETALLEATAIASGWNSAKIWRAAGGTLLSLCFLVVYLWLPTGWRGWWEWAFWVIPASLLIFMLFNLCNAIMAAISGRKLAAKKRHVLKTRSAKLEEPIPIPITLLSDLKAPGGRRAILALALLFQLVFWPMQYAIPLPGHPAAIHSPNGETAGQRSITRLHWGEWWEYTTAPVRGVAYAPIYYDERTARILVLSFEYEIENKQLLAAREIRSTIAAWGNNIGNYISQALMSALPTGAITENQTMAAMHLLLEMDEQGRRDLATMLEKQAVTTFRCKARFTKAEVVEISVAEYRKYMTNTR